MYSNSKLTDFKDIACTASFGTRLVFLQPGSVVEERIDDFDQMRFS